MSTVLRPYQTQASYSTSAEAYAQSKELLKRLGLSNWYQIARLAISRSMVFDDLPKHAPDAKGSALRGHQLFGDEQGFNLLWTALLTENLAKNKPKQEIALEIFQENVRNHWHRGAALLSEDWLGSGQNYAKFIDILVSKKASLDVPSSALDDNSVPRTHGAEPTNKHRVIMLVLSSPCSRRLIFDVLLVCVLSSK